MLRLAVVLPRRHRRRRRRGRLAAGRRALHPLQRDHGHRPPGRRTAVSTSASPSIGPNDEIKEVADTFDAMLERLDRAFDGQGRFVANASHELRTPLTINRTLIEVALDDPDVPESRPRSSATTLLAVNRRHEQLIDGLLTLASSEQRLNLRAAR